MAQGRRRRNDHAIALVAQNIRKQRNLKNLTLEELAFKLDTDYSQVSRMERGKVNFSISILIDIAKVLEVEPALLLKEI